MDFLVDAHSGLRWLVLAGLVAMLAVGVVGWSRESSHPRALVTATSALVDVQVLIGIIVLIAEQRWDDSFYGIVHPLVMLLAASVFKVGKIRAKRDDQPVQGRKLTVVTAVTLALILSVIPW